MVDATDQMALVQVQRVSQLLLGEGAEVVQGVQDGYVSEQKTVLSQDTLQVPAPILGYL